MSTVKANLVILPLAFLMTASALVGCGAADPAASSAVVEVAPPEKGTVVADFVAHFSPRNRAITFHRAARDEARPGLAPQDLNHDGDALVVDADGNEGSGSTNTVELVTNSVGVDGECPAGYQTGSFCGNVTLRSFYGRSFSDVFVQVTNVTDAEGNPLLDHGGLNRVPAEYGLENDLGLWKYSGQGVSTAGVLGQNNPFNAGSADWVFANPDNAETWIYLRVVAAVSYTDYAVSPSSTGFIDACAVGSLTTSPSTTQSMPFPFTFWDTTSASVSFNKRGMATFGNAAGSASGNNECLPSASAPAPGLFVFWDNLTFGPNGRMCWATIGEEPNRRFVIEWSDMDFATDDPGSSDVGSNLTFEAILSEGTNNIDVVYDSMLGPSESSSLRPTGASATVGIQNSTAIAAPGATCGDTSHGTGSSFTFAPIP